MKQVDRRLELMVIRGGKSSAGKPLQFSIEDVTPVILAGGLGTRLRSAVPDRQKVVAEVQQRPFVSFILDQVREASFRDAVLCVGHMSDQVQQIFGTDFDGLSLSYSIEQSLLGTAGALRFALPQVKTEWVLAMNGDSFCDVDLQSFIRWAFEKRDLSAAMALVEVENRLRYGSVDLQSEEQVAAFIEKGAATGPGLINAGIYLIHREVLEQIPKGRKYSLETEVFPRLVEKGLYGFDSSSSAFIDIGTPDSFERAQSFFADRS